MSKSPALYLLQNRTLIEISGEDSQSFLQRLLTNDLRTFSDPSQSSYSTTIKSKDDTTISDSTAANRDPHSHPIQPPLYALLLTPNGRVLYDFILWKYGNAFYLECHSMYYNDIITLMHTYRLRARVDIVTNSDLGILSSSIPLPGYYSDPRHASLGYRSIAPIKAASENSDILKDSTSLKVSDDISSKTEELEQAFFTIGLPQLGRDYFPGELLPTDLGLHYFNAINFQKGCYVGQEAVNKVYFRGTIKRSVYQLYIPSQIPWRQGAKISHNQNEIGCLLGFYGCSDGTQRGLALLRTDAITSTDNDFYTVEIGYSGEHSPDYGVTSSVDTTVQIKPIVRTSMATGNAVTHTIF